MKFPPTPRLRRTSRGKWVLAFFAVCAGVLSLGGCVIIPTIPHNAAGYGHDYRFVDENGRPIKSGLLLMTSVYYEGANAMVNCYPIVDGLAHVPAKIAVRYGDGWWAAMFFYIPFGYYGWFQNPKFTIVNPLVAGRSGTGLDEMGTDVGNLATPPDTIRLVPQAPDKERRHLEIFEHSLKHTLEEGTREDKAAAKQALDYIAKRLSQLPPGRPRSRPADD